MRFFREEEYVAAGHAVLYKEEKTKEKKKRGKKSCKDRFWFKITDASLVAVFPFSWNQRETDKVPLRDERNTSTKGTGCFSWLSVQLVHRRSWHMSGRLWGANLEEYEGHFLKYCENCCPQSQYEFESIPLKLGSMSLSLLLLTFLYCHSLIFISAVY